MAGGPKGFDNGLVLLIKTKTDTRGEVAIATGYGLEAVLTDAVCKRIIEEEILPQFRQDRYFEGIQAGLDRIKLIASGEYSYSSSEGDGAAGFAFFVLFIVFIIVFLALVSKKHKGKNGGSDGNKGKGGLSDLSKAIILSGMLGGATEVAPGVEAAQAEDSEVSAADASVEEALKAVGDKSLIFFIFFVWLLEG